MNRLLPIAVAATLTGCASSMSGIGGSNGYACKAPEGALCTSVSGVYANSRHALPAPGKTPRADAPSTSTTSYGATSIAKGHVSSPSEGTGTVLRSAPRVLRVWIAAWEDSDGDLHEASMVHVVVDTGRWLIDHVRPTARDRIQGVTPPNQSTAESATKLGVESAALGEPLPPAPVSAPAAHSPPLLAR